MKPRSSLYSGKFGSANGGAAHANKGVEEQIEAENEAVLKALSDDVSALRRGAMGMRDDVREHNRILDTLSGGFQLAQDGIKATITKLEITMSKYGAKQIAIFSLVMFGILVAIYMVITRPSSKAPKPPSS